MKYKTTHVCNFEVCIRGKLEFCRKCRVLANIGLFLNLYFDLSALAQYNKQEKISLGWCLFSHSLSTPSVVRGGTISRVEKRHPKANLLVDTATPSPVISKTNLEMKPWWRLCQGKKRSGWKSSQSCYSEMLICIGLHCLDDASEKKNSVTYEKLQWE